MTVCQLRLSKKMTWNDIQMWFGCDQYTDILKTQTKPCVQIKAQNTPAAQLYRERITMFTPLTVCNWYRYNIKSDSYTKTSSKVAFRSLWCLGSEGVPLRNPSPCFNL